jgi:hypothetical protein
VKLTTHLHLVPRPKNAWSHISIPQYAFMAWCLVMHRDSFTFMTKMAKEYNDSNLEMFNKLKEVLHYKPLGTVEVVMDDRKQTEYDKSLKYTRLRNWK